MNKSIHFDYSRENRIRAWMHAMRLRTLPLSISGIVLGGALASKAGSFSVSIFLLSIVTGTLLQILSNFANDYGDAVKGSDGKERVGPQRTVASGLISKESMLHAIQITVGLIGISTFLLIYVSFGINPIPWAIFLVLAACSVWAAIRYTMGENPYGYAGKGDFYVFVFFGLITVCGSYGLYSAPLLDMPGLPACAAGLLSVAVLNVNNIRDMRNDEKNGKITFAVKLGSLEARKYHLVLVSTAFLCWVTYFTVLETPPYLLLMLFSAPIVYSALIIYKSYDPITLDKQLKITALSTGIFHTIIAIFIA